MNSKRLRTQNMEYFHLLNNTRGAQITFSISESTSLSHYRQLLASKSYTLTKNHQTLLLHPKTSRKNISHKVETKLFQQDDTRTCPNHKKYTNINILLDFIHLTLTDAQRQNSTHYMLSSHTRAQS